MDKKLDTILLIDDDISSNFLHKRLLKKLNCVETIYLANDGQEALDILTKEQENGQYVKPNMIFLDINMPVMDGWEFLDEFQKIPVQQKSDIVLIMLTSSLNPDDKERSKRYKEVSEIQYKLLTKPKLNQILETYFS